MGSLSALGKFLDTVTTAPIREVFALFSIYDPLPRALAVAGLYAGYLFLVRPLSVFRESGVMRDWKLLGDLGLQGNDPEAVYFPVLIRIWIVAFLAVQFL